jgi:hypothetical protein
VAILVTDWRLSCVFLLQPSDPSAKDENAFFSRINKFSKSRSGDAGGEESDAATDDGEGEGDRRHLLQKVDPKEPKEVRLTLL